MIFDSASLSLTRANYTLDALIDAAGTPAFDRLLWCKQRKRDCEANDIIMVTPCSFINLIVTSLLLYKVLLSKERSEYGKCWRINPNGTMEGLVGIYGRLTLAFFADLKDYSHKSSKQPTVGFTVHFHIHEIFGGTFTSGYMMSPGRQYKVLLQQNRVTTS